mgnify:CR=1 FL=1
MKRFLFLVLLFIFSFSKLFSQGDLCVDSEPFCTNNLYTFPAGVDSGFGEDGPDYGCLTTQPNPAWYHMKIAVAGDINIQMSSNPTEDIDFICWGPFSDPATPCSGQLTSSKIVDCSYLAATTEDCYIPNGQVGEYYILLITNYSNDPCDITFEKTSGTGETDCGIVPPPIGSNTPVCVGETLDLWAENFPGATYSWTGPNSFSSSQQNPSIPNVTMANGGTYELTITANGTTSDAVTTEVEIIPNSIPDFSFNIACQGENTIFQDLSTVDPPSEPITSWDWDFGDGQTSSEQNPTHLYTSAGDFEVSLTTYTGSLNCAQTIVQMVSVSSAPIPDFDFTIVCFGEPTEFHDLSSVVPPGEPISSWEWDFGDGQTASGQNVSHTYAAIGNYQVTLTIYVGQMSCEQSITKTASIIPSPIPDFEFTNECLGNITVFTDLSSSDPPANPITTWEWNFGDGESAYGQEGITHLYAAAGNYQVILTIYTGSLECPQVITKTVPVYSNAEVDAGENQTTFNGGSVQLNGTITQGSGNYNIFWTPETLLDNPNIEDPNTVPLSATQVFNLTVVDAVSLCENSDQTTVIVEGGALFVIATTDEEEICNGEEIQLSANSGGGSGTYTYAWTSNPPGFSSNLAEPIDSPSVTTTYFVEVGDGQSSVNGDVTVAVIPQSVPNFNFNNACFGDTTFFVDNSAVDPPIAPITAWEWDFGDGQSSNSQNSWHLYGVADDYNVVLTTYTGSSMQCSQNISKTVHVYNAANVDAGEDHSIVYGWPTTLNGTISGASGNYDILWTPENMLVDPSIEDPQTINLEATQVFTLTVTDTESLCSNSDITTVIITGGPLGVSASAIPTVICEDEIVHLSAIPSGGSGNNTYSWTSNPPGFTSTIKEPSDFPNTTTTYYVEVFDGQLTSSAEVIVQVNPKPIGNAGIDKTITVGTNTILDGASASGGSGNYTYSWEPLEMLENPTVIYPQTIVLLESLEYTFLVNDENGCQSIADEMWVFAGGSGLTTNPTASEDVICVGDSTYLSANAFGGGENYTYHWTTENGFESTESELWVFPDETTIYTLEVNDGFIDVNNTVTVSVNNLPLIDLLPQGYNFYSMDTIKACVKDSVILDAANEANPSTMNYLWSNTSTSSSLKIMTVGSWIDFKTNSVIVENPVTLCKSSKSMTVFFDFNECGIGVNEINSLSENISVSPNPSNGQFYINIQGLEKTIDIYIDDISGKRMYSESNIKLTNTSFEKIIDITPFTKGIYLISIVNNQGVYRSKIIKQ